MKKVFIFLFLFLLLETTKSQTPSKVLQIQFDFGGERDDIFSITPLKGEKILVSGIKIPYYNAPSYLWRSGMALFDKNGTLIWKKVIDDLPGRIWSKAAVDSPNDSTFVIGIGGDVKKISYNGDVIGTLYNHYGGYSNFFTLAGNNNFLIATKAQQSSGGSLFVTKLSWNGDSLASWNLIDEVGVYNTQIYQNHLFTFGIYPHWNNINYAGRVSKYTLDGVLLWTDTLHDYAIFRGCIDELGDVYTSGTFSPKYDPLKPATYYKTTKWSEGVRQWERLWAGDFDEPYNDANWVDDVIPYPGGGCIVVGSLTQPNNQSNPNYTDFGAIAYDSNGEVRWKMRFQAYPGWWRNDLWAATWDNEGYLWLAGSAYENDTKYHRYIFLTKWFVPGITKVESEVAPRGYELYQNYPNPFNPTTTIRFTIPHRSNVTFKVFDVLGKEIAMLVDEEKEPGEYSVNFDASGLPSGVYFYKIKAGEFTETKKMILMK
jgi:hypothetical protein